VGVYVTPFMRINPYIFKFGRNGLQVVGISIQRGLARMKLLFLLVDPKKVNECSDKLPVYPVDLNVPCSPVIILKAAEL
jgi:hypothetical protein